MIPEDSETGSSGRGRRGRTLEDSDTGGSGRGRRGRILEDSDLGMTRVGIIEGEEAFGWDISSCCTVLYTAGFRSLT